MDRRTKILMLETAIEEKYRSLRDDASTAECERIVAEHAALCDQLDAARAEERLALRQTRPSMRPGDAIVAERSVRLVEFW